MKRVVFKNADGSTTIANQQTWFEKNQKTIIIIGVIALAGLLLLPDVYLKKYIPWVK